MAASSSRILEESQRSAITSTISVQRCPEFFVPVSGRVFFRGLTDSVIICQMSRRMRHRREFTGEI